MDPVICFGKLFRYHIKTKEVYKMATRPVFMTSGKAPYRIAWSAEFV